MSKTLSDLLHGEVGRDDFGVDQYEAVAGLVGAVQEWLTQPEVVAEAEINIYPSSNLGVRRVLDGLRRQAGEGLDS